MSCVFCDRLARGDLIAQNAEAVAFEDGFPLTLGHALVPRRHEADFLQLTPEEQRATRDLVSRVMWKALTRVIGQPELADVPRFAERSGRVAQVDDLEKLVEGWTEK